MLTITLGFSLGHTSVQIELHFYFLDRLLRVDVIKWVSNVCLHVRTSIRTSTKSFFDFNEIWYVGRGRRVMHDVQVGNSAIFKGYLLPHLQWRLANDHGFLN